MSADLPRRRAVALVVMLAAAHLLRWADLGHTVDDAWISFRVARTWLETGALTYDAALPPVEGMTNLLWTLLAIPWVAAWPDVDPIHPARLLGGLLHLATVGLAADLAARLAGGDHRAALVTGGLLAASGSLAFYALSGLETPLYAFLLVLSVDRLVRGASIQAGLALGALAMTRPEGVLLGGVLALVHARRQPAALLGFGAIVAGLELFRWAHYGALVPNTFHAKAPTPSDGWTYLAGFLTLGLGGLGGLAALPALRQATPRLLGVLVVLSLAGTTWSGGDWMPGFRRFTEVLVLLAVMAGVAVRLSRGPAERMLMAVGLIAWLAGSGLAAMWGRDGARFEHGMMAELGRRAAISPGVQAVALVDIGRFGWSFPGRVVDLVGLTDPHLAHLPGGHADKPWDEQWFRQAHPDLLIARSQTPLSHPLTIRPALGRPEVGMVESVLTHGGYHLHTVVQPAADQWLLIFARDGLTLDPAVWGPRWPVDLPELMSELHAREGG